MDKPITLPLAHVCMAINGCVYSTSTSTRSFVLRVPSHTVPLACQEIFRAARPPLSSLPASVFCQFYRPYLYNTIPPIQTNLASLATQRLVIAYYTRSVAGVYSYLKVTIICRYIFLRFQLKTLFASTKFCNLYAEMVQDQQILIFYTVIVNNYS